MTEKPLSSARTILATPRAIFRAVIDPDVVTIWRAPDGVTAGLRAFDPRVGGGYKLALTATNNSKTAAEIGTLESSNRSSFRPSDGGGTPPARVTMTLAPMADGTKVSVSIEPPFTLASDLDAETMLASVLKKLANLLE